VVDSPQNASVPPTELKCGLSRYTLVELLGRGTTTEVHLALGEEPEGLRPYAVKLFVGQSRNPPFAEAILQLSRGALRLERPNVVQIIDAGLEEGQLFLVLEYVDGFDLADLLRRCAQQKVPLPVELGLHIVMSTLRGLEQSYKLVGGPSPTHAGVSLTNILIGASGGVKLGDFGMSRADHALRNAKAAFALRAGYMSPEQARGEPIDARTDVFAAGVVLFELLVGRRCYRPPRAGTGAPSLLTQALAADIPPLPSRGRRREAQLYDIVQRALSRRPEHRHPSPSALLHDLEAYALAVEYKASDAQLEKWLSTRFSAELTRRRLVLEEAVGRVFAMKMQARSRPPDATLLDVSTTDQIVRTAIPDLDAEPDDVTEMTYIEPDDELPTELRGVEPSVPVAKGTRSVMPPRSSRHPPSHAPASFQPPSHEPGSFQPPQPSRQPPPRSAIESGKLPALAAPQLTGSYPSLDEVVGRRREPKPEQAKRGSGFLWFVLVVLLLALVGVLILLSRGSSPIL
jgi:serine/threonine-protein kinase